MKEYTKYNFKSKKLNLPKNKNLIENAKQLRKAGVLSEVLLWKRLCKKQLYGLDIDRQKIIGNYIVDFYIKRIGLVIEIDGFSHENKFLYDMNRQEYLESLGLDVFRIQDIDVKKNIDGVIIYLKNYILENYLVKDY